ncbi:Lrp/AsnC family transcriptional regulator [Kiloniella laminariae]|uniref:Lrp/AsnC family transcriptional regulator n=1 Tax=Kiloniella laminariae TaxID=454162 RepID=A0ABT4LMH5_9PROT|nr:Lrp/AsnC family transcriptional regulator [Kiloniella laminariae]MCZ4282261.1 Lrp/AsnC family transcriptional regulator [Kiloniella laminariae]
MTETLDDLDIRILEVLQQDVTIPVTELAEQLGSSKSVCWRRIQRLLDNGVIKERVAILDQKKIGLGVTVFAQVKMHHHVKGALPDFVEAVRKCPQVIECHTLMGSVDFLLKIVVGDIEEYERFFWQELSQIEGVQEISSSTALTRFVDTTRLPLEQLYQNNNQSNKKTS